MNVAEFFWGVGVTACLHICDDVVAGPNWIPKFLYPCFMLIGLHVIFGILYVSFCGLIYSVREERANFSAVDYSYLYELHHEKSGFLLQLHMRKQRRISATQ